MNRRGLFGMFAGGAVVAAAPKAPAATPTPNAWVTWRPDKHKWCAHCEYEMPSGGLTVRQVFSDEPDTAKARLFATFERDKRRWWITAEDVAHYDRVVSSIVWAPDAVRY